MSTVMNILMKKYHPDQYAQEQQQQEEEINKQSVRDEIIARYKSESSSESKKDTPQTFISPELRQVMSLLAGNK